MTRDEFLMELNFTDDVLEYYHYSTPAKKLAAHDAEQRQVIDEQVEENRGLRSDVLIMQKEDAAQRALIEHQAKEIEVLREHIVTLSNAQIEANAKTKEYYQQVINRLNETITSIQAQLATAKGRETRLCSLLQRAQTIITLDADIYTIWREDAGEELVK